jgi:hypothetical protein
MFDADRYCLETRFPMTTLTPAERCLICDGWLVPPQLVDPDQSRKVDVSEADYVCIKCLRPYYWRGNPPRLVCLRQP